MFTFFPLLYHRIIQEWYRYGYLFWINGFRTFATPHFPHQEMMTHVRGKMVRGREFCGFYFKSSEFRILYFNKKNGQNENFGEKNKAIVVLHFCIKREKKKINFTWISEIKHSIYLIFGHILLEADFICNYLWYL